MSNVTDAVTGGPSMQHRVKTNVDRAMKSVKDTYASHSSGLLQEVIQNAVDAKRPEASWKDWSLTIRYDPGQRVLNIRDYGTTGMPHCPNCNWGELPNGETCAAEKCGWGVFHGFAFVGKEGGKLGSRGQGKSLAIVAGKRTVVRTLVASDPKQRMASVWKISEKERDWTWELSAPDAPPESWSPGTEIEVHEVIDEVHKQFMNRQQIVSEVNTRWYPLLKKGGTIRFGYSKGPELKAVNSPTFPALAIGNDGKEVVLVRQRLEIKHEGKTVGELLDLRICLAAQPFPENDPRQGVALIKNGMQVIARLNRFPRRILPEVQQRIFGEVTIPCTKEQPFLQPAEDPNHRGYKTYDPVYLKVRTAIEQEVETLVEPFLLPLQQKAIRKEDHAKALRALDVLRKAIEEVPELKLFGGGEGGETDPPSPPKPPPDHPYISHIDLDRERYTKGDTATTKVVVLNPTNKVEAFDRLELELRDSSLQILNSQTLTPVLPAGDNNEPGRAEADTSFVLPDTLEPGRYRILAKLTRGGAPSPEPFIDRKGKWLWLDLPPPLIKRPRRTRGGATGSDYENNLRGLDLVDDDLLPPEVEAYIGKDASAWVNLRGPRIKKFWNKVKPPGLAFAVLYELMCEELLNKYVERRTAEEEIDTWPADEVKKLGEDLVSIQQRFLRACVRMTEE